MIVLATFFGRNLSLSDFSFSQVTSVEKRESQQHFSASAYGLGLKKLCFDSLFSTSVTWEKLKSDKDKFFLRVASTIIETKYYCIVYLLPTMVGRGLGSIHGWANGSLSKFPEILFLLIKGISELNAYTLSNYMCPTVFPIPEKWEKLGAF